MSEIREKNLTCKLNSQEKDPEGLHFSVGKRIKYLS